MLKNLKLKQIVTLLILGLALTQAQILDPAKWSSTNEDPYKEALVSSASYLYDYAILDYDLTVQARAADVDNDGENLMIYFTVFDQEGDVVSKREYDFVEGDIRVCRTNVENEYFYIYGSEHLYAGFVNAQNGEITRDDQIKLSEGYSSTFSYAACSLAGDRMYIIATYGTNQWNTIVMYIDLGQSNEYTIGNLQYLSSGVSQTQVYTIQGYSDGSAIAYAQSSSVNEKFQKFHFSSTGQLKTSETSQINNGFFNEISSGNIRLSAIKDLKSEQTTLLYGNSNQLQIFTVTNKGEQVCFKTLDTSVIEQFYNLQYGYIDQNTVFVINTVSDVRVIFLIDPETCKMKYQNVYNTKLNYANVYPVISDKYPNSSVKLWIYGSNSWTTDAKVKSVDLGEIQQDGCIDYEIFQCLECDSESEKKYTLNDNKVCESPFDVKEDENGDGDDDGKGGSKGNNAAIIQVSVAVLAALAAFFV